MASIQGLPWEVQESSVGTRAPARFFKEEQELDRCERLWVRGKRNGLERAVKRKRRQDKLAFQLDLNFICEGMRQRTWVEEGEKHGDGAGAGGQEG